MNDEFERRLEEMILTSTSYEASKEWVAIANVDGVCPYNYRGDHVRQVVATVRYLALETGADINVVTMAAWLHDISKPGLGGADNHGEKSARIATTILMKEGFDSETIKQVTYAIRMHVGLVRDKPLDTLEAQVLWEADKLVKLGVIGFLHYVINGLQLRPGMNLTEIYERLDEFLPLAEKIAGSMYTQPAKQLASERFQTLKSIIFSLRHELNPGGDE